MTCTDRTRLDELYAEIDAVQEERDMAIFKLLSAFRKINSLADSDIADDEYRRESKKMFKDVKRELTNEAIDQIQKLEDEVRDYRRRSKKL